MTSDWWMMLEGWSEAVGVKLQLFSYPIPVERRNLGDWWRNGQLWCVHLDSRHYAQVSDGDVTAPLQRALTWTLRSLSTHHQPSWQETVCTWLTSMTTANDAEFLSQMFSEGSLANTPDIAELSEARLVWIHFRGRSGDAAEKLEEFQDAVLEIVTAFVPDGFLGWIQDEDGFPSALLLLTSDGFHEQDSHLSSESENIRRRIEELLQSLAADAWVLGTAVISSLIRGVDSLYHATVTLAASWRGRAWLQSASPIVMWGDQPIASLLQSIPREAVAWFLEVARIRSPLGDVKLSAEMEETLLGLIQANLNVSEAARLLYMHRNTLTNRIERIRQQTGYDIRSFQDAMVLWLANIINKGMPELDNGIAPRRM